MSKNARDRRPYLPPVTRIELSEKNIKLRWILIVLLLSIAVVSIVTGLMSALNTEPGWQEVQATSTKTNCAQEFVLMYEFGRADISATAEYKNVSSLYSYLTEQAYVLFSSEGEPQQNVAALNRHVNETVQVSDELYHALSLLVEYDCRIPFLAPAVTLYNPVFLADSDVEASLYDPNRNEELQQFVKERASYGADPAMINLELLGNNQVRLNVADAYLAYAREEGIETFFDFGWMKNAFIADYMAEKMLEAGYTSGYLVSYDGFTRNLDTRGDIYSFNIFDRWENTISIPARLHYSGSMSIAALRNFPLTQQDRWHYYAYEDGGITGVHLSPVDGANRSSTDNLVSYSQELSCAEILMQTASVFLAETLDNTSLEALAEQGIHSVWAEANCLRFTGREADFELLPESGGADYRLEKYQ